MAYTSRPRRRKSTRPRRRKSCFVVGDSRSHGIHHVIQDRVPHDITTLSSSGAKIYDYIDAIEHKVHMSRPDLVVLNLGLCDITSKSKSTKLVRFDKMNDGCLEEVVEKLYILSKTIRSASPMTKVIISTIYAPSIPEANKKRRRSPEQQAIELQQQEALQETLMDVNYSIVNLNLLQDTHTPYLDGLVRYNNSETGKVNYKFHLLKDGIHPTGALKKKIGDRISKAIVKTIGGKLKKQMV